MVNRAGVVTPEGVLLDYRPAGLATRSIGRLVDISIQFLLVYVVFTVAISITFGVGLSGTVLVVLGVFLGFLLLFVYPVMFEVFGGGRTPGHRATGTRVICTDGGPVTFRHAAIRSLLFLIDGVGTSGFAGAVSVLVSKRGQRLGDLAAGTMVVRLDATKVWDNREHPISTALTDRASTFEARRLEQADVDLARTLVERGADFFPGTQLDLATRLAKRLDDQLGGVMTSADRPADFLVAVIGLSAGAASPERSGLEQVDAPARDDFTDATVGQDTSADVAHEQFETTAVVPEEVTSTEAGEEGFAPPT